MKKLTYSEFRHEMQAHNKTDEGIKNPIMGVIVFTEGSFDKEYSKESRSYKISSDSKAFISSMGGYSIFGSSLDDKDVGVRLEKYMADEYGDNKTGWKVDYCYLLVTSE